MKVLAARRRDAEDISFLVKHMHLDSAEQVLALCAEIFPDEEVPARARLVLEDIFRSLTDWWVATLSSGGPQGASAKECSDTLRFSYVGGLLRYSSIVVSTSEWYVHNRRVVRPAGIRGLASRSASRR
jgi:hypothetical protein